MALNLGELSISYKLDKDGLRRDLREGEGEVKASGDRMGRNIFETALRWARELVHAWTNAGHQAAAGFWQDSGGRWHDAAGKFVSAATVAAAAAGHVAEGVGAAGQAAAGAAHGVTRMATGMGNAVTVALLLGGALVLLIPAVQLLGGVLGSIPALTTGGIAALGTLLIGFIGIGDAFKKTSSSGASMADRLRQIALAERRLADANKEATASQDALNRARATAAERLRDLQTSITGAELDEADAADALAKARRDLDRAQQGGNSDQIRAAERAFQRAVHNHELARDRLEDLKLEQADAARKGVEGSDEVTAALERQKRATEGVEDATYDLRRAQRPPAGGGAAAEATKIAASAMAAVTAIKSLKGWWESLRLDIQERLFAGTDVEIKQLAASWDSTLRARLGSMASMFNGLFKKWAETSKKPEFIANIAAGWESIERLIDRVGRAVAGPGLEAFGKLSRYAQPMLDAIGDVLAGIVESFAQWVDEGEQSGELQDFFKEAGYFFRLAASIGGSVVSIIGSIIDILSGGTKNQRETSMETLAASFDALAQWFDDPENQAKIEGWFHTVEGWLIWVVEEAIPTVAGWISAVDRWAGRIDGWIEGARKFRDGVMGPFNEVVGFFTGLRSRIDSATSGMWDGIRNSFRATVNWVIDRWNALEFPAVGFGGITITQPLRTPDIPRLANGGLVKAVPGGRHVVMAEAGEDEIASPVSQLRQIVAEELARVHAEGGSGPSVIEIPIYIGDEVVRVVRYELKEHDRQAERAERAGAGKR